MNPGSQEKRCRIFGHGSGNPGDALNSRASFERVRALECEGVELDVRRTADDQLAVIHDPLLDDGRDVAATRASDLPRSVMLLDDVLDLLSGMCVNIEIKNYQKDPHWDPAQGVTHRVLGRLAARGHADDVILSSFGGECLDTIRDRRPDLVGAQLLLSRRPVAELLDDVVSRGLGLVHPYDTMVDQAFMQEASARGLTVNAWTAEDDSAARLGELIRLGVDGVITGAPEVAGPIAELGVG